MHSLRTILMSGVAAVSLAAAPALAQQATTPEADAADRMTQTGAADRSYENAYGEEFADWGDRTVDELLGTQVVNEAGETIGEISDFGLSGDQLVAIVGVGGFLGVGEHDVAIPIDELSTQGDQVLLAGVTREQLEAMPEYDEAAAQTFAADQTLRGGYEGGITGTSAEEEVAETTGEATDALGEAGEGVAQAADEATDSTAEGAETAEAAPTEEPAADETDMAETEPTGQSAAEETEVAGSEQPVAGEQTDTAEAADETMATEEPAGAETEMTEGDAGWTEEMDSIFADIADREIAELLGMDVASSEGEVVGQVDNFALEGQDVVAIVGVGGFLGIGEHEVALSLEEMTYDGERLVLSSMTEEQLREMPEYEGDEANRLPEDETLRSTYDR